MPIALTWPALPRSRLLGEAERDPRHAGPHCGGARRFPDKFVEAYFPPGAWWVGRILEMRGEELLVKWHGTIPSWIDAEGEFSAPDEEKLVRILGFKQPSDMGPFVMDDIDI